VHVGGSVLTVLYFLLVLASFAVVGCHAIVFILLLLVGGSTFVA
jgi:hypothetical protein